MISSRSETLWQRTTQIRPSSTKHYNTVFVYVCEKKEFKLLFVSIIQSRKVFYFKRWSPAERLHKSRMKCTKVYQRIRCQIEG